MTMLQNVEEVFSTKQPVTNHQSLGDRGLLQRTLPFSRCPCCMPNAMSCPENAVLVTGRTPIALYQLYTDMFWKKCVIIIAIRAKPESDV